MLSFGELAYGWMPFECSSMWLFRIFPETSWNVPSNIHLFKVNNINTKIMHQICSQLTLKKLGWRYWSRSVLFIVSFEHILHTSGISIVGFEEVNIRLFKANNGYTRIMYQICSKLTIKKLVWRYWSRSGVLLLLTLNIFHTLFWRYHCWFWRGKFQMRRVVLDICDNSEMIKLPYVLQLN